MSIRRAARPTGNFTILHNEVFSAGLSFRAMGMLAYLLSKPDHWEVSVAHLVNLVAGSGKPDGRDAVYATIAELIGAGFIVRKQARAAGRMAGFEYEVFDTPRRPEPDTAQPDTAEPTQVRTDTPVNTDEEETPLPPVKDPEGEAFERTWAAYPKRAGGNSRAAARKAWDARRKQGHSADDLHAGTVRYAAYIRATNREGTEYVKQAASFFGPGLHFLEPWSPPRPVAGMHTSIDTGARSTSEIVDEAQKLGFRTMEAP